MANILIGISGSIAAFKSVLLIRQLQTCGHQCKAVITSGGIRFVTPELIAGLGVEVFTDQSVNFANHNDAMLHINLAKWADVIMIAPASANTMAKIAAGMAEDILSELILAAGSNKCLIAPAMNYQMWSNPITQDNIQRLINYGFKICYPDTGIQACGDFGQGRLAKPEILVQLIEEFFNEKNDVDTIDTIDTIDKLNKQQLLCGKTILLTLGATIEAIDPVRYISNHSSGKMGKAIAENALHAGAKVIAIQGNTSVQLIAHPRLKIIGAKTADIMLQQVIAEAQKADIFIACAAVSDYRVTEQSLHKIKKNNQTISLELTKNPDILKTCKEEYPELPCIGFAAETENVIDNAINKLKQKKP